MLSRLEQTSAGSPDAEIAALERDAAAIGSHYETWLNGQGAQITQALDALREFHSDLSAVDGARVEDKVRDALNWCIDEVAVSYTHLDVYKRQRLKSLSIHNFRSIHGSVVIPLDAQVVLVHGTNGMGKTSLMSAIELGLTGSIAHLEDQVKYQDCLLYTSRCV